MNEIVYIFDGVRISQDPEEEISSDDSGSSHVSERIVSVEDRKNKTSDTKKEQSKVLQQSLPKKDGKKKIEDTERKIENVESIEKNTEKTGTEKDGLSILSPIYRIILGFPLLTPVLQTIKKKGCASAFPYCFLTDFTKFFF